MIKRSYESGVRRSETLSKPGFNISFSLVFTLHDFTLHAQLAGFLSGGLVKSSAWMNLKSWVGAADYL